MFAGDPVTAVVGIGCRAGWKHGAEPGSRRWSASAATAKCELVHTFPFYRSVFSLTIRDLMFFAGCHNFCGTAEHQ